VSKNFLFDFFTNGSFTFGGPPMERCGRYIHRRCNGRFVGGSREFLQFSSALYNIRSTISILLREDTIKVRRG